MPSDTPKALAALSAGLLLAAAAAPAASEVPPGFTMDRTGGEHDFAYFEGAWTTVQRRLKAGTADSWDEFPATMCARPYMDGHAAVDELWMPTLGRTGLTLRTWDHERRQWSAYWVSSLTGRLDPIPVVGGFDGRRGEFYASDQVAGRPIKVRYLWTIADQDHARWEQAFSYDDRTWVTNWTADFTRADAAELCEDGKPKRAPSAG